MWNLDHDAPWTKLASFPISYNWFNVKPKPISNHSHLNRWSQQLAHWGPIFDLPHWIPECIRFCAMHILCLGVDLFVAGNVLRTIVDSDLYDFWGNGNDEQQLLCAWQQFKAWAKQAGWSSPGCFDFMIHLNGHAWLVNPHTSCCFGELRHSVPRFTPKKLRSTLHGYPEYQSKAWNVTWLHNSCSAGRISLLICIDSHLHGAIVFLVGNKWNSHLSAVWWSNGFLQFYQYIWWDSQTMRLWSLWQNARRLAKERATGQKQIIVVFDLLGLLNDQPPGRDDANRSSRWALSFLTIS